LSSDVLILSGLANTHTARQQLMIKCLHYTWYSGRLN